MEPHWSLLLPAALLACYPLDRLLPRYMKCRTSDALTDPAAKHRRGWWRWQPELWLDVVRVAVAAWLIDFAFQPETATERWIAALAVSVILAVGLCCQMWTRREEDSVLAPITFLTGTMLALLPPAAALAVFTLAITATLAFRSYIGFFVAGMGLTSGLTYLLGGGVESGLVVAVLNVVALMAGFLSRGEFVLPLRERSSPAKTPIRVR